VKYMILLYGSQQDYDAMVGKSAGEATTDKPAWSAEDFAAMGAFMQAWNQELVDSGEFVDARGLAEPLHTRRVQLRGGAPVVTDGPYPEAAEVIAGYTIVDCESFDRATEIAARLTKCPPGPGDGEGQYVDVRPIMDGKGELEP
jgi:hypothetical protein